MKMKIYGMTKSKGTLEDGTPYDSAKIYSLARLKDADNHNGFAGVQLKGIPAIYEKWLSHPYTKDGVEFEVETDLVAGNNASSQEVVVSMNLINPSKK